MTEVLKAPRGTNDIIPPNTAKWTYVEDAMRYFAEHYGFQEIRTPIFEHTALFQRGIGEGTDIVTKEMYTFTDKGGRSLTLRPELTAPAIRAYIEHNFAQASLVKWYYFGSGFRYERPQSGRFRQFNQFGVEAIGSMNPQLDAEVISLAVEIFRELDLKDLEVKINSIGCKTCRPAYRKVLIDYFSSLKDKLCEDCATHRLEKNPLRILDCKVESCHALMMQSPTASSYLCEECEKHFRILQTHLKNAGIEFVHDRYLVRGLDYYTKTVFEVISKSLGAQNTLCGGGRYDDLVESLGGPSRPAVGFATGMERIILLMESLGVAFPPNYLDLYVVALGESAEEKLFPIMLKLRRLGLTVQGDYNGKSLGKQLKEADQLNAHWALIVGENELKSGHAIFRDMKSHEQTSIPMDELEHHVIQRIWPPRSPEEEEAMFPKFRNNEEVNKT